MFKEAIQYIADLGFDSRKPEILDIGERTFYTNQLTELKEPTPAAISISTLTGLVDYIKTNVDRLDITQMIIHVVSATKVKLISCLRDDQVRECFIEADARIPKTILNNFIDQENFIIMLQSCFVPSEFTQAVFKVVGNIKQESVRQVGDDGISQEVTARVGIAKVANVVVPNPVELSPYRTYIEVEQPESKFVLRMQDGPKIALFEADGGAWTLQAMQNIKKYLEEALMDTGISIIA